jgi:2-oxoglutarate dehydrogenase E1 component
MASLMETMQANSLLFGANATFVEETYEAYLANPASVAPEWRAYFDALPAGKVAQDVAHSRFKGLSHPAETWTGCRSG